MAVIVITGVPGTGKTTIAKILSKKIGAIYINLTGYAMKKRYVLYYDNALQTYIVDEDEVIKDITEYIKKNPGNYIIESTFAHLLPKDVVDIYVVLKTDPNELYKRLKERDYPYHKIFENIWAMNLEVIEDELEYEKKQYYIFDTTSKDPNEVVESIIDIINIVTKKRKNSRN